METGNEKQNVNIAEIQSKNNQYMKEWYWQKGGRERLSLQRKMRKFLSKEEYYKMFPKIYYNKKDNEKFIRDATRKHGNKYSYDKVLYKNNYTKVVISCPIHGEFYQQPVDHLGGHGCPLCSADKHKGKNLEGVSNSLYGVKNERSYMIWSNMLLRTIDNPLKRNFPTYEDCELCEEWKEYANFKVWYDNPENGYMEGYDLDKDLLSNGRKIYSPETCCFIPKHLNFLLRNNQKHDGLPNGVYKNGKGYRSRFTYKGEKHFKQHKTIEDARKEYQQIKMATIKNEDIKLYSKHLITEKVYKALIKYSLENLI